MANIGERIEELIGTDYNVIPVNSVTDLINAAIAEIADSLPSELLLKYILSPTDVSEMTTSDFDDVEGRKILLVTRELNSNANAPTRECKAVPLQEFNRCLDENSLYEATKYSPVYAYIPGGVAGTSINVAPAPDVNEKGFVYTFTYPTSDQTLNDFIGGFPPETTQAVVLKASINILQSYISDFVQEEEDSELQGMLEGQKASLEKLYQTEMGRYIEPDSTPRGE